MKRHCPDITSKWLGKGILESECRGEPWGGEIEMTDSQAESTDLITVYINNKGYRVPEDVTIMQAYEYAGYQFTRGCGCRGGVCGACSVVYRIPGNEKIETGLACQTLVQPEMCLTQIPFFPENKATYDIDQLEPTTEQILELYPELSKCMGCNTCTKSCPMDIDVMECVSEILRGNIEKVADRSISCIMCKLCASRCPAGLTPDYYFLLCRRLYGRHIMKPLVNVPRRISEIESGEYEAELDRLMTLDPEDLRQIYRETQLDKQEYDGTHKDQKEMWNENH